MQRAVLPYRMLLSIRLRAYAIRLRACYAQPGTDLWYLLRTQCARVSRTEQREWVRSVFSPL
eukprot:3941460-Rhodomonas_salina.2